MGDVFCPATMCPLFAKDGSPWTGQFDAPCPERDGTKANQCPWWGIACGDGGHGLQALVEDAVKGAGLPVIGPNRPRRETGAAREYDCPRAPDCSWQKQAEFAGFGLCPPRRAMAMGADPRVVAF